MAIRDILKKADSKVSKETFSDADIISALEGLDRSSLLKLDVKSIPDELKSMFQFLLEVSFAGKSRKTKVFHPSSLSYSPCPRKDFYELSGVTQTNSFATDTELQITFDVGHFWHKYIQFHLWYKGVAEIELTVDIPEYKIYGHADGRLKVRGKLAVLKIKTMDTNRFSRLTEPLPYHIKQATIYAKGLDAELIVFVYVDKNKGKRKIYVVVPDEGMWAEVKRYCFDVTKAVRAKTPPKRVCGDELSERAMSCPYRDHCFNLK